ncbi:MAG: Rieske (2Fe-2S) protein [Prolixibacteraceae bacterium]|jgi:cytochrome b6-f complex iron-sulfur subunit|nr:Rieske (2Fe-2S) protein [Prolixibacteraceae bacterium]MBT6005531.1 Rieske (2Fe-2S) protein [Prolixibacteraceae bacterium]MBT6766908.1 Rieske (2Fe-2S) protein [Prolixibacteraceae bacterium]MBT6997641.1 Rieske (2Fe-2S) protein [Prolixibacteraceae bacterium]MBT7394331.1 Rieske (2Fe-2S) protein [Prolixibacteraceae bacterium]
MERKDFIKKFAVGGSILMAAPAVFNACSDPAEEIIQEEEENNTTNPNDIVVDLNHTDFTELKTVGGYAYSGDIIIFRSGDTQYVALSKICTHEGCTVTYSHDNSEVPCACHGSKFSTTGSVTNGPATTSLKKYTTKVDGTNLIIS